jgi:anti-anti-sigma factor
MLKPSVQVREEGGVLTAEFWDCLRLDPAPITTLRTTFEDYRKRSGKSDLVVDLNGVAFAGSAALGGFLGMRKAGARLIFCNVDPNIREVFRVSKLDPLFSFAEDKPAAIALAHQLRESPADGASSPPVPRPDPSKSGPAPLRRRKPT